MMCNVAQDINTTSNRPHIAIAQLFEELGAHILAILNQVSREARYTLQLLISLKSFGWDAVR